MFGSNKIDLNEKQEVNLKKLSIRIEPKLYHLLNQLSKESNKSISTLIREILNKELINNDPVRQRLLIERSQLKAISEVVYILREISGGHDSQLKEKAKHHAAAFVEKLYQDVE